MTLAETITDYVQAAFSGLWIVTHEPDEAERELILLARDRAWKIAIWDIAQGLRFAKSPEASLPDETNPKLDSQDIGAGDPLAVLRSLPNLASTDGTALLLLHNFHKFLSNPEVMQTTFAQLIAGKEQRTFIVVLAPVVQIPIELEKLFVVLEHALPDRGQILKIAEELTTESPEDLSSGTDLDSILDAAAGLTRYECEGAFALSLARHDALRQECIWELKAQTLKKSSLVTLYRGDESFESLGGLANLKDFCRRALQPGKRVKPRGCLLLGVSGSGKSAFAKALGTETRRPTLMLDIGSLYGSLVGSTEANVRQVLRIADAMSPCILMVDEVEKALSGIGGQGDSGVSSRLFGHLLTWLADHESDVFFVATANDISKLPPEFSRAERFDGIFFIDLPDLKERDSIWHLYRSQFQIPAEQSRPDDSSWTGAEIKSCCRLAALLDQSLTQAALQVVPVAVTAAEQVDRLRAWASGRCLSAAAPGIYRRDGDRPARSGRRVHRPSDN